MDVSCHRPFLPDTSLERAVNPTAHASSLLLLLLLFTPLSIFTVSVLVLSICRFLNYQDSRPNNVCSDWRLT